VLKQFLSAIRISDKPIYCLLALIIVFFFSSINICSSQRINDLLDQRTEEINLNSKVATTTSVLISKQNQTGSYTTSFTVNYDASFFLIADNHGDADQFLILLGNSIIYEFNSASTEVEVFDFYVYDGYELEIRVNPGNSSSYWSFTLGFEGDVSICVPPSLTSIISTPSDICENTPIRLEPFELTGSNPINYSWQIQTNSGNWYEISTEDHLDISSPDDGDMYKLVMYNFCDPTLVESIFTVNIQPDPDGDGLCGTADPCPDEVGLDCLACTDTCYEEYGSGDPCAIEKDTDGDTRPDCSDACPTDPNKWNSPGLCGCGEIDVDVNNDQVCDIDDGCNDYGDPDGDGVPNCLDNCPNSPIKTEPGICGCDQSDVDADGDSVPDCNDICRLDPLKTDPGICGCGVPETCNDCVNSSASLVADECGPVTIIFGEEPCTGVLSVEWLFATNSPFDVTTFTSGLDFSIIPSQPGYYGAKINYENGSSQSIGAVWVNSSSADIPPYLITEYDGTCASKPYIQVEFYSFKDGDRIDVIVEGVGIFEYRLSPDNAQYDIPIPNAGTYDVTVRGLEYNCYASTQSIILDDIDCDSDCADALRCNDDAKSCALFSFLEFEIVDVYEIKVSFNSGLDNWMQDTKTSDQDIGNKQLVLNIQM